MDIPVIKMPSLMEVELTLNLQIIHHPISRHQRRRKQGSLPKAAHG
jgi:hypothetical protein